MADDGETKSTTAADDEHAWTEAMTGTLYAQLRDIAARQFASERRNHTLQPTALVHEAYLRLSKETRSDWQNSRHFRAIAARVMRRILVDHARAKSTDKRGAGFDRVCLTLAPLGHEEDPLEISVVNDLLETLASLNPRHAQLVELRIFGGLALPEIAESMGVSLATVKKDWRFAKAWLTTQLADDR